MLRKMDTPDREFLLAYERLYEAWLLAQRKADAAQAGSGEDAAEAARLRTMAEDAFGALSRFVRDNPL
jgi:hypothetical protein